MMCIYRMIELKTYLEVIILALNSDHEVLLQDITEGMEFHVVSSSTDGSLVKEKIYTSSIKLTISETIASISLR